MCFFWGGTIVTRYKKINKDLKKGGKCGGGLLLACILFSFSLSLSVFANQLGSMFVSCIHSRSSFIIVIIIILIYLEHLDNKTLKQTNTKQKFSFS